MDSAVSQATCEPTHSGWRWWLLLALVGCLALCFRFYYVTHTVVVQNVNLPGAHGNAAQYYNYARNLVEHDVFSIQPASVLHPTGDSFRDPGYPVFLAVWMKIFPLWDNWYAAVLLSQAILGAATVALWLCIGRRWMPMKWLLAAGIFMAVWPHSVAMSSNLLSETLYGFLVALAIHIFSNSSSDRPSVGSTLASALCFALAALTNSVFSPFAILLATYMLTRRMIPAKTAFALIVAVLCLITPWMIRNRMQPVYQPSSTNRALMNLVEGSWPQYHDADMASIVSHDPQATRVMGQINREIAVIEADHREGLSAILQRMALNPGYYALWYLQKPALLWGWNIRIGVGDIYFHVTYHSPFDTNSFWRAVEAICHTCNNPIMLLALLGCLLATFQSNQNQSIASAALLLLYVTIIHSTLQAEPRYSIPYRGPEIMLGMYASYWISSYIARLRDLQAAKG